MSALAFMAGLAKGGMDGYMMNKETDRRKKDEAWREEQRAYIREQRENERSLKTSMMDAVKPREAQSAEVYSPANDDQGNVMPANPTAGTFKIDDQFGPTGQRLNTFATMAGASEAATAANTPQAQMGRMSNALMAGGQPEKAMSLRTSMVQGEAAEQQLKRGKEQDARDAGLREVGSLIARGGWGSVPQVYARYDDGFDAQVIEDGKGGATVITMKDGKEVDRDQFADLQQFYATAASQFKPELWLQDHKDRIAGAAAGRKEARDDERLELERRRVEASERRMEALIAGKGKGDGDASGVALKDRRDFLGDVGAMLPKPDPLAEDAGAAAQANQRTLAQADAIFATNAERGTVLTAPQAVRAMQLASDPKNVKVLQGSDGMAYETVNVNGTPVIVSAPMKARAPGAPAAERRPVASMAGVAPAPAAAPQAPARPVDRIGNGVIGMLTPMAMIQESAAAGNPRAIEHLKQLQAQEMQRAARQPSSTYAAP